MTATGLLFFALVIACWHAVECEKNYTIKPRMVLPDNYVKVKLGLPAETRPPSQNREPVIIEFSIYVVDINSINVEDMDFRVDLFVRQRWVEPRLEMPEDIFEEGDDFVTLPANFFDNLWHPDPYILNAKASEIATLTHKFSSVTLYRNKTIRYAARMHAIVACQMEFQLYPMDIQVCPMAIESFSYTNQKLRLVWGQDGVTVNPELKLLQYNVGQPLQLEESNGFMLEKEGNYSRLVAYFRFERQIGHHLIQTFAPSALVVMLSWFSFWLGLDAIPGRVTLLVTSMLTLVTMFTGLKSDIPPVAYVKALDLWMAGCMVFVFAALGEFVVVKVLDVHYTEQKTAQRSNQQTAPKPNTRSIARIFPLNLNRAKATERVSGEKIQAKSAWDVEAGVRCRKLVIVHGTETDSATQTEQPSWWSLPPLAWTDPETGEEKILWREIDRVSRLVFPFFFLLFVLTYWPILLLKKA
ncbi:Hypothetical predicted protein [Cloeon dipterum]|uniref:Neurotransmitter-gated ion-channel ligand-binding domain-containing protein n=1 Tax=Cloeon dipterum TaxID=197152 RepID=A0A8S1BV70_9INSE|nr:Hypothetical predicted protein [Cloeon dipterum]